MNKGVSVKSETNAQLVQEPLTQIEDVLIPATNIEELNDCYILSADMPGVQLEDVLIELGPDSLQLKAINHVYSNQEAECLCKERSCGVYARRFELTGLSAQSSMELNMQQGVVTIKVSK